MVKLLLGEASLLTGKWSRKSEWTILCDKRIVYNNIKSVKDVSDIQITIQMRMAISSVCVKYMHYLEEQRKLKSGDDLKKKKQK